MGTIYKDGINYSGGGGNTTSVALTQAEYDALPEAEKNSDTVYFITDAGGSDNVFYFKQTSADTYSMTFAELKAAYDAKKVGVFMGLGKNMFPFTGFIYRDTTDPNGEHLEIILENPSSIRYTLIVKPDDSVTVESSDSGWLVANSYIKYRKKNGTVYVQINGALDKNIPQDLTTMTTLATLPEGFRPAEYASTVGYVASRLNMIGVHPNGDVAVAVLDGQANIGQTIRGQITFPV